VALAGGKYGRRESKPFKVAKLPVRRAKRETALNMRGR
jgi:hypothetical protein